MPTFYVTVRETRDVRYRLEAADDTGRLDWLSLEEKDAVLVGKVHRRRLIAVQRDLDSDPEEG